MALVEPLADTHLLTTQLREVKQLWLDLDGTLLGSSRLLHAAFVWKTLRLLGPRAVRTLHILQKPPSEASLPTNWQRSCEVTQRELKIPHADTYLRKNAQTIFQSLRKLFRALPEAQQFTTWAKQRYPLVLATNPVWPEDVVQLRLDWAGIPATSFVRITHGENMHAFKPDLQYYQELLQVQNISPRECLLVGDSLRKEGPATRLGIPVCLLRPGPTRLISIKGQKAPCFSANFELLQKLLS